MPHKEQPIVICRSQKLDYYKLALSGRGIKDQFFTSEDSIMNHISNLVSSLQDIPFIIIEAELGWNGQTYYGFRLGEKLRIKGLLCPFFFLSSRPFKMFNVKLPRFALLRVYSHHRLVTLPLGEDFLAPGSIPPPMLEIKRQDIIETLLSERGLAAEITHELKNKILTLDFPKDSDHIHTIVNGQGNELLELFPEYTTQIKTAVTDLQTEIGKNINQDHFENFVDLIDGFKNKLNQFLPSSKYLSEDELKDGKRRWKVLLFDDDREFNKMITALLEEYGISCYASEKAECILNRLKDDKRENLYTVLICDVRIYKNDEENESSRYWDEIQGYDLLYKVRHEFKTMIELVACSSGRSRILNLLERQKDINIHRVLKQQLQASAKGAAHEEFIQKIKKLGDDMYFKSRSKPRSASWLSGNPNRYARPLAEYYREHLFARDYSAAEDAINQQANDFLESVLLGKKNESHHFTGNFTKDYPSTEAGLNKFRSRILLGRRIALGLKLSSQFELDLGEIYLHMVPSDGDQVGTTPSETAIKQLFNSILAISFLKDVPSFEEISSRGLLSSGLLEEEIRWLIDDQDVRFELEAFIKGVRQKDIIHDLLWQLQEELAAKGENDENVGEVASKFLAYDFDKIRTYSAALRKIKEGIQLAKQFSLFDQFHQEARELIDEEILTYKPFVAKLQKMVQ